MSSPAVFVFEEIHGEDSAKALEMLVILVAQKF
jgi:hypothetical protein